MEGLLRTVCRAAATWAALALFGSFAGGEETSDGLHFYLLEDETIDFKTARKMPLSALVLRDKPWIACEDIDRYDVSTHCVYLKRAVPRAWKRILLAGTPFVAVAGGQRCYLGALWTHISSWLPAGTAPVIYPPGPGIGRSARDLLHVTLLSGPPGDEPPRDVRSDPRILKALRRHGQYSAGLECSLDGVTVRQAGETSSVRYTYTIRNPDSGALYVLDPTRINTDFFHDFQNGVRGRRLEGEGSFSWPNPRKTGREPTPWGKVDLAWFSLLKNGESTTRTVVMEGLPRIRPGKYECHFAFSSPEYLHGSTGTVKKSQRRQKDGRIWLGRIEATRTVIVPGIR